MPERARKEADKKFFGDYTSSTFGTNHWVKDHSYCIKFEWGGTRPPRYRSFALTFGIMDYPTLVHFLVHGTEKYMDKFRTITLALVESELIFVFTTKMAENISHMYRIMQTFNAYGIHIRMGEQKEIYLEIAAMSKVRSLENELDVNRMNCKSGSLSANDLERLKNFYERTIAPVLHKYPLRPFFNGDYSFERMQYHKGDSVQSDKPEDSVQSDKAKPKAKSNPQPDGDQAPKRKRGRPRKVVSDIAPVAAEPSADSGSEDSEVGEEFPEPRAQPMRTAKTKPVSYRESYQADHSDEEDFDVNGALEEVNGPRRGKRGRTGEWPGVSLDSFYLFRDLI